MPSPQSHIPLPLGFEPCKLAAKPITSPKIHPNASQAAGGQCRTMCTGLVSRDGRFFVKVDAFENWTELYADVSA